MGVRFGLQIALGRELAGLLPALHAEEGRSLLGIVGFGTFVAGGVVVIVILGIIVVHWQSSREAGPLAAVGFSSGRCHRAGRRSGFRRCAGRAYDIRDLVGGTGDDEDEGAEESQNSGIPR